MPEPEGYTYTLGLAQSEVDSLLNGDVPESVKDALRELVMLMDETPTQAGARRKKKAGGIKSSAG